jgi:SpoVK/Ycf46/Vps4 family AAA+-type ATPase
VLSDALTIRLVKDNLERLQATGSSVVFLASRLVLPSELEKDVSVIDYPLPDLGDMQALLEKIERGLKANSRFRIDLEGEDRETLLQSALGLTLNEARNVFAKALVSDGSLSVKDVALVVAEKEQLVRKSGILEYYPAQASFAQVAGLDELKSWLRLRCEAFGKRARDFGLPPPKGLLLCGVPGTGKSLTAKAVASEWQQPLIKLDVGKVFAGIVGSSEENIRKAIRFAEATAPAVLWLDEIEYPKPAARLGHRKAFAVQRSSGDSGAAARVFSTFLTWLQEKASPVFVVATANDITVLPPELLRKGRFDEIFFVDLPFEHERQEALRLHIEKVGRQAERLDIDLEKLAGESEGFSGAEIEQVVHAALYRAFARGEELSTALLLGELAQTHPLSRVMAERIAAMRDWARYRTRSASSKWRDKEGKEHDLGRWAYLEGR